MSPDISQPELFDLLAGIGRERAGPGGTPPPEPLYDRHGVLVVRVGGVVVKAHQADRGDDPDLGRRVALAGDLPELFAAPLGPPLRVTGGFGERTVTVTAFGEPVRPDDLPWEAAARLLAGLHRRPVPPDAPGWGRPTRVARLVERLPDGPAAGEVRRAFATLPAWIREGSPDPEPAGEHLIHGDWHLGQMVRLPDGSWRFIDVEDLGRGDPVWDLARPAALYSAGVLRPADWTAFLTSYRAAGGPAVPLLGDPWARLDIPARTLAIQIAATCVISARGTDRPLDEAETALVDACTRISRMVAVNTGPT
ncbi:phosphotransferase family protein [Actinomadura namibiensis]|uniref:Aminoglycoside phosphotransferase domain-containing protein n=1 Tax=Actinomadura namibiensis TaxID=182080 RepID=A0A7W3LPL1_ACTNM|nr:phosphotransferase [Actinomadura namibiensis]MBA8952011.1 hypothetical protein [Actinomadura namibiensis]